MKKNNNRFALVSLGVEDQLDSLFVIIKAMNLGFN